MPTIEVPTIDVLFESGVVRDIAGNRPLLLDDFATVWQVVRGPLEVFATRVEAGEPTGPRVYVCTLEAGQLIFGASPSGPEQMSLIVVGTAECQARSIPLERLREALWQLGSIEAYGPKFDQWVSELSTAARGDQPQKNLSLLQPGSRSPVAAGKRVSPVAGTLWISGVGVRARFLERTTVELGNGEVPFPLSSAASVTLEKDARLSCRTTADVLASETESNDTILPALDRFHQVILQQIAANAAAVAAAEQSRLELRSATDSVRSAATVSALAASLVAGKAEETALELSPDPLVAACQLVGARMHVEIVPPKASRRASSRDPVEAVAHASRIRTRRIVLSGEWWAQDGGPLVGFTSEEQPVALLPLSASRYEIVNPATRRREPLTPEAARALSTTAYCFYRPFPEKRLGSRDLIRLGVGGTSRDWIAVGLTGLLGAIIGLFPPIATGILFDRTIPENDRNGLMLLVLAMVVGTFVAAIMQFTQGVAMLRIQTRMDGSTEAGLWDRLLNLPASFFRQFASGDLAMRAMGLSRIRQALTEAAMSTMLTFVFSGVSFVLLYWYDVRLANLALLLYLAVIAVTVVATLAQLDLERKSYHVRGRVAGIILQLLTGIARIRVAGAENRAIDYWAKNYSEQMRLTVRAQTISNNLGTFMAIVPAIASLLVFYKVSALPPRSLSLASFLAFNAAFVEVIMSAVMMSGTISSVLEVVPLYERASPVLKALPESFEAQRDPGELTGDVEVSHVSFRYEPDGPLILNDVTMHIRPGEFVAIVGPSGAGKSTILRMLLGFETPSSGSIYYDREDITGVDLQALRRQIGVVLQNGRLSPGDLFSNITGSGAFTLEDAWEAARMSGLESDIKQMPMGMYTVITEGESTFSGGQRQRLLIARAIVSRPKILLFDEATSALDNVTQATVSQSLEGLKSTRIVIAHRLSTIINADRIFVMEKGRLVQQGTYEELMQQPGTFAELAKRQLA
ncbi:MAG: NHLP bacteriocin export ABC transporter permease/ATPase subunit [Planctomycetaceae bacterium]|nr:NHLP bacteriocin export ABC transporter permease/ATPase subunit [Planctomycetaceae bacterium]